MNFRTLQVFSGGLLLVTLAFLLAPSSRAADDAASLYKAKCAGCHAPDGSGNSPVGKAMKAPDLRSDDVQKKSDAELIALTTDGKGKMPAYKGKLTDDQIKGLVGYVRELGKKK